jgi:isopentenyl-diphosphate Delta-isomerase
MIIDNNFIYCYYFKKSAFVCMRKPASKKKESSQSSARRKRDHVDIVLKNDVTFRFKTTGFESIDFVHNALPECNFSEIDSSVSFLGKKISAPLLVSCMTGGFSRGESINRSLAQTCQELSLAVGVGSQRQMLDDPDKTKSFRIVREHAPGIPVLGNIGAAEVAQLYHHHYTIDDFMRLVDVIEADALVVHLNPLQELMQREGNTNFRGVLDGITRLVAGLPCPVIVKEVGAGISADVARRLFDAGVRFIDIAGAGGTSWAGIEMLRRAGGHRDEAFWDWGIPTYRSLKMVAELRKELPSLRIIASGGITDGITAAKAIAAGADIVAAARPFLEALMNGGKRNLKKLLGDWIDDIRRVQFLTGARTIDDLKKVPLLER